MLRKKASGVARGPQSASFVGKIAEKAVDRRAFLKGSGLAIGGVAAASAFVGTSIKPAQAVTAGAAQIKRQYVPIVLLVVRSWQRSVMASGQARAGMGQPD